MPAPNSSSFTNPKTQPVPTPTPLSPPNSSTEPSTASFTVSHTIVPPPPANHAEAFLNRHKLVLTTTAGAVTSGIAGTAVYIEGKKYSQSQQDSYNKVYDRCRTEESLSNEDAIFYLTTYGFSDEKILNLFTSSSRIEPLKEGQKNCITMVNGKRTASTYQCKTEQAEEVPGASYSNTMATARIDLNGGIQNVSGNSTKQLIENGQILILDSKDCDSDILNMEESDNRHYICVENLPSESPNNPKSNYPQRYAVLVLLFGGLAGLFTILSFKFINLTKEQEYIEDPGKFNRPNYPNYSGHINKEVENNLINILIKYQQKIRTLEETRALLTEECSFSETVINEILKNI